MCVIFLPNRSLSIYYYCKIEKKNPINFQCLKTLKIIPDLRK